MPAIDACPPGTSRPHLLTHSPQAATFTPSFSDFKTDFLTKRCGSTVLTRTCKVDPLLVHLHETRVSVRGVGSAELGVTAWESHGVKALNWLLSDIWYLIRDGETQVIFEREGWQMRRQIERVLDGRLCELQDTRHQAHCCCTPHSVGLGVAIEVIMRRISVLDETVASCDGCLNRYKSARLSSSTILYAGIAHVSVSLYLLVSPSETGVHASSGRGHTILSGYVRSSPCEPTLLL